MQEIPPYALSIAGFDPSGGAGVLADVKTFEANGVYGFGVVSALTWQNDVSFRRVEWVSLDKIKEQVSVLLERFAIRHFKIGLIESARTLIALVAFIREQVADAVIVYDPIFKASAGFAFHNWTQEEINDIFLSGIYCITPNIPEAAILFGDELIYAHAMHNSTFLNIYLKGGHSEENIVSDIVFVKGAGHKFANARLPHGEKHGSGCVLSSALTARLALGNDIVAAAKSANRYTHQYLASSNTLLGYHKPLPL